MNSATIRKDAAELVVLGPDVIVDPPLLSGQSLRRAVVYTVGDSFQFCQPPPVTRQILQNDLSFHVTTAPCAFETLESALLIGLG
jgi:hypothetical protein